MEAARVRAIARHLSASRRLRLGLSATSAEDAGAQQDFRYTVDNPLLSWEQRRFYEENGFLVVKDLLPHGLLDECRERFVAVCEGRQPKGQMTLMKDVSYAKVVDSDRPREFLYNKLQDVVWDDVLSKYVLMPQVLDHVECFTGPNIMAMHTMLINKPPDSGKSTSRHPLHQDLYYFAFRPADRIVASWTAMERVTRENGCLHVLPGSHRAGELLPHLYPGRQGEVNKLFVGVQGFDEHPVTLLEMDKGDTVFFHPLLIHGSGVNRTQGCRKAISCHYAASECEYIDVAGTVQEGAAREVAEIARRRGFDMDYKTFWALRNRLARGKAVNL